MSGRIHSIQVNGLFNKFNYTLDLSPKVEGPEDGLRLLYGRNGSGKSTLLGLIYHALSGSVSNGHRSAILATPFGQMRIEFENGDFIEYSRERNKRSWVLNSRIKKNGKYKSEQYASRAGIIPLSEVDDGPTSIAQFVKNAEVEPVFLTDYREIISDLIFEPDAGEEPDGRSLQFLRKESASTLRARRDEEILKALRSVQERFRTGYIRGSQESIGRVDEAYAEVVSKIATSTAGPGRPRKNTIPSLIARVKTYGKASEGFERYGLLPPIEVQRIVASLEQSPAKAGPLLNSVLDPYLSGAEQRLSALSEVYSAVDAYVQSTNSFLEGKELRFDFGSDEIKFADLLTKGYIDAVDLSSGEKQLILLLSYVAAFRERTRLLIIDEPEISLNPDWQRLIVPKLLSLTSGSDVQMIFATHSIEILAPYDECVIDLREQSIG